MGDLVTDVAVAIERADNESVPYGTINHPEVSDWGEHIARVIIPIVLKRAAEIARNPGFIQAQDSEWDSGVEYAKRFIAEAIERAAQP